MAEPFRSLSVNSQIPNSLNVISSIDLTVTNKTKSDNTFEFVFHLNNEYELNLSAESNEKANVDYDSNKKTLTISNILVDSTNDVYQDATENYGQLVGWNITKTSMDNVVSELLELSNGEVVPGNISSPIGIVLSNKNNKEYLDRFINLMKVNGLENADQQVDNDPNSGTILNKVEIKNYKNQNNRKTVDIILNLGSSLDSDKNLYYFAKNNFDNQQVQSGVWYEYDDSWTTLTIHNFPLDSYQVNNYWEMNYDIANWILKYMNFNINKYDFEITNLNDSFYQALGIEKTNIKNIKLTKAKSYSQMLPTLQINTVDSYTLENNNNGNFEIDGYGFIYYEILNNNTINIFLNGIVNIVDSSSKIVDTPVQEFISSIDKLIQNDLTIKSDKESKSFQIRNDQYSEYLNEIAKLLSLEPSDINYVNIQMKVDNNTNKWILEYISIRYSNNVYNFWNKNPEYSNQNVQVSSNGQNLKFNFNKSTNWNFESTLIKLEINSETMSILNQTLKELGDINIESTSDYVLEDKLKIKLNENNFSDKFINSAFKLSDSVSGSEIEEINIQNSSNSINPTFSLQIELPYDSNYIFVNNESVPDFEISNDGKYLTISNICSSNITNIWTIDVDKDFNNAYDALVAYNPTDSTLKLVNKDSSGKYAFNTKQINSLKEVIKKNFKALSSVDFNLEIELNQSFEGVEAEKFKIVLPNGYKFIKWSSLIDKPKFEFTLDEFTPNVVTIIGVLFKNFKLATESV